MINTVILAPLSSTVTTSTVLLSESNKRVSSFLNPFTGMDGTVMLCEEAHFMLWMQLFCQM